MSTIVHPFDPVFDSESKILILGSFPSVKSRENSFYYGHPQNRFWKIVAEIFNSDFPHTIKEKKEILHNNKIALWDVIECCEIQGSSDSSIKNVKVNDINSIIKKTKINKIYVNGKAAEKYYYKYQFPLIGIDAEYLPSTSPANAKISYEELIVSWSKIKSTD